MTSFDLSRQPTSTGVYVMKDAAGDVLYVGKANNLRARLRSYVKAEKDTRPQVKFLMERAATIETIVTDTEKEALILENTLIKKHRPRYNIHLRDDKTFVSLRIDLKDDFPMLEIVRRVKKDGARYFGPFASASALRQTLKEIYRIFPLRHYPVSKCRQRGRPCLFHQIGQCSAPCHGKITIEDYHKLVDGVIAFLEGRKEEVVVLLRQRMLEASGQQRYEEAALLRDQIQAIEKTLEEQKSVRHKDIDRDVVGIYRHEGEVEFVIMFYRQGKLTARRSYGLPWHLDEAELLAGFLTRFYNRDVPVPDEVLLPFEFESLAAVSEWLSEQKGRKVKLSVPSRGERRRLLELANRNAEEAWRERGSRDESRQKVLQEVQQRLRLARVPERIECFDISTIQGQATVASMAVLVNGEPMPAEYRHYKVKTVAGTDDYAALAEVLRRRLERGLKEDLLPDFILIDGGKGQLGVLDMVLDKLQLSDAIDAAGIAKSRVKANVRGKVVERSEERFFLSGRKNPVVLKRGAAALFLLERLRDEAHRFAITYHRKLRSQAQLASSLSDVPGVGAKRQKALLKYFGSLKKIKAASLDQLAAMPGLPRRVAEAIYQHYRE